MTSIHWNYFIAIEEDLKNLFRYIEPVTNNFKTYSIETAKILMTATQEVDVLLRAIGKEYGKTLETIDEHYNLMKREHKQIFDVTVTLRNHSIRLKPFKNWKEIEIKGRKTKVTPAWWQANNDIKHNRDTSFHMAKLINTINAVGALLLLNIYYHTLNEENRFWPEDDTVLFALPREMYATGGNVLKRCLRRP